MTNRLATSQSLYLRKHAENPIDWWPWCDEALAAARREDRPIFLSIGYSSCHWCTVMEGEAFSDSAIAAYMNANFLPIKVDREERPDLDSIYMQTLQMMVGQGGWPLNVFLDPTDLVPFYGGTYFPAAPRYGRPGFLQVLQTLRQLYDDDRDRIATIKAQITAGLQQSALLPASASLSQALLEQGLLANAKILMPAGQGTRFPMMPHAIATLQGVRLSFTDDLSVRDVCRQRAFDLALGGIYDHVGGGFHRYTVDPTWTVPHFEKMLYDNGLIVEFLADIWSLGEREAAFEQAVQGTVDWLQREMSSGSYFYAAQDADSFQTVEADEPEEGAFYVWSEAELRSRLTAPELAELKQQFTVTTAGNFEGANVLQRRKPGELSPFLSGILAKLFAARYGDTPDEVKEFPPAVDATAAKTQAWPGRIPPVTDTKMIVAWNSLMISGLARAAAVWGRSDYLTIAASAAQFILQNQRVDGRLHRLSYDGQPAVLAQSEDYALLIKALIDLHQARLAFEHAIQTTADSGDSHHLEAADCWLEHAIALQSEFDQWLWSEADSGYYNTASDASDSLLVRERSYQDSATPAANGIAIGNLVRLFLLAENLQYFDRAEQALRSFGTIMERAPRACPSLFQALDWWQHPTLVRTSAAQMPTILEQYLPTAVVKLEPDLPAGAVGLVCQGLSCQEPASDQAQLMAQLKASQQGA
ncbi:MAG: thioredoxin domain-containing protein [Leptolyngbya sp. SIO4C1]|nr:thioredoxin domain-containing protein [Leptolyngbya sp. SIO4C1]